MCYLALLLVSAAMTLPNADNDWLIFLLSSSRLPWKRSELFNRNIELNVAL